MGGYAEHVHHVEQDFTAFWLAMDSQFAIIKRVSHASAGQ
jgi:hypothetical protein